MDYDAEIGGRIRELRLRSSLTAADLAERAGLSPSAWSRIEHGDRSVKTAELSRIADLLGVSPLAILDGDSLLGRLPVAARAIEGSRAEGSSVIKRLTALAELDDVLRNGDEPGQSKLVDVPSINAAEDWLDGSKSLAAWVTDQVAEATFADTFTSAFERLVFLIQSVFVVDVVVEPHDDPLLGAAITDRSFPLIFVNAAQNRQRCTFTLAHELGHILLGGAQPLSLDRDLTVRDDGERFANAFAAALLMPDKAITAYIDTHGRGATSLAHMLLNFGVSFETLVYRLHNLEFINHSGRDNLKRVGFAGLLSQIDDVVLRRRLLSERSATIPTSPPLPLTARAAQGWQKGVVSIRPLAGLLGEDPDDLLASFDTAGRGVIDADYSESIDPSPELRYADSPI